MHPKTWLSLALRVRSGWTGLTIAGQFAIAVLVPLALGMSLLGGWVSGRIAQEAVAVVMLAMVGLLFAIVCGGSETIAAERQAARDRAAELSRLLEQNADLRRRIDESHRSSVEINDLVLRRVGVELHDGPAQLISLALLRLDFLRPEKKEHNGGAPVDDFERIRGALEEALAEIRSMSAGLALPELGRVSPGEALRLAARNHERRTATSVACDVDGLPRHIAPPIKSCLYRFAQEALNNAYRHAGGRGQTVRGICRDSMIEVEVADDGPGFEPDNKILGNHLGLVGMRERVASLGGTLEIVSRPGAGTRLTTRFKMADHGGGQS